MFKLLGKTSKSISFRQMVEPYIINQKQIDEYNNLSDSDKEKTELVTPIYLDYKDFGVFNQKVIINATEIREQKEATIDLPIEEIQQIEMIQPKYETINDYTNFFGNINDFKGTEFQIACQNYINDKGL